MMNTMLVRARGLVDGVRPRSGRAQGALIASAALTILSSCGGSSDNAAAAAVATTVTPTTAPATAAPTSTTTSTTEAPTTTESTTTTAAPTTTTLPAIETVPPSTTTTTTLLVEVPDEPIAPPADEYGDEPVVEVGSIAIPKLGVDMTMFEGIRLTTLEHGPGHWPGTAMPGQTGNVVVGGHRVSSHRVFRDVDQLDPGDEILFRDDTGEHRYLVNRVEIVQPDAVWIVNPTETATATLFACHPPGSTAQRIVVFADLADPIDG